MKKLIFILLATIWCIGANGQKIKPIDDIVETNVNDSTYFENYCVGEKFRIFRIDTIDNTINYYVLTGWWRKKDIKKIHQGDYHNVQQLNNDKCAYVDLKKRTRALPAIKIGTAKELGLCEKPIYGYLYYHPDALTDTDIVEVNEEK